MFLSLENSILWMNPMYNVEAAGTPADDDKGFDDKAKTEEAARNNKIDVDPMLTAATDLLTAGRPNYVPQERRDRPARRPRRRRWTPPPPIAGAFAPNAATLWTDGWTDFPVN